jgi:phage protein U/F0F1-type ATP synthase membrane subunit b/b'
MFAQLGEHIFQGLKTPASWGATHAARYGKVPLVNGKDVLQHTGSELSELKLEVRYLVDFCEPSVELAALKASMEAGEALPFLSGEGDAIGKFVITGMDVAHDVVSSTGRVESATVSLSLLEYAYGEAVKPKPKVAAHVSAKPAALSSANPVAQPPAKAVASPAKSITSDISQAKSKVSEMKAIVRKVQKGLVSAKRGARDVRKLADSAKQLYASAKTKVEVAKKIKKRAQHLPTSLDDAIGYINNLAGVADLADTAVLEKNVTEMSTRAGRVSSDASTVAAFAASREGGS